MLGTLLGILFYQLEQILDHFKGLISYMLLLIHGLYIVHHGPHLAWHEWDEICQ